MFPMSTKLSIVLAAILAITSLGQDSPPGSHFPIKTEASVHPHPRKGEAIHNFSYLEIQYRVVKENEVEPVSVRDGFIPENGDVQIITMLDPDQSLIGRHEYFYLKKGRSLDVIPDKLEAHMSKFPPQRSWSLMERLMRFEKNGNLIESKKLGDQLCPGFEVVEGDRTYQVWVHPITRLPVNMEWRVADMDAKIYFSRVIHYNIEDRPFRFSSGTLPEGFTLTTIKPLDAAPNPF